MLCFADRRCEAPPSVEFVFVYVPPRKVGTNRKCTCLVYSSQGWIPEWVMNPGLRRAHARANRANLANWGHGARRPKVTLGRQARPARPGQAWPRLARPSRPGQAGQARPAKPGQATPDPDRPGQAGQASQARTARPGQDWPGQAQAGQARQARPRLKTRPATQCATQYF